MFGCKSIPTIETVSQPSTPDTTVSNPEGSIDLSLIMLLTFIASMFIMWVWRGND